MQQVRRRNYINCRSFAAERPPENSVVLAERQVRIAELVPVLIRNSEPLTARDSVPVVRAGDVPKLIEIAVVKII